MLKHLAIATIVSCPALVHAAQDPLIEWSTATEAAPGELYYGIDATPEYRHQDFARAEADLYTLRLAPYVQYRGWELALDLPWQHIEGEYFINRGRAPSASFFCRWIENSGPLAQVFLARRGLSPEQIQYCADNEGRFAANPRGEVSGWSDFTLDLGYGAALVTNDSLHARAGLSYKWDNADGETGLGTGTRDTRASMTLVLHESRIHALADAGYTWFASDDGIDYRDRFDASVDVSIPFTPWLSAGAGWQFEESNVDWLDDAESASGHVDIGAGERIAFSLFYTDWLDVRGFPDSEYGASMTVSLAN